MTIQRKANLAMGAFLTACLIPAVGMFLLPQAAPSANQTLASPPRLLLEDGSFNTRVLNETADYVKDHLGFRQELITANAAVNAALFRVSSEESVLLGRDGWLFYRETLDDYLHTEPLPQRQLYSAAHTLALLSEYVQSKGARLLFTAAPNKATLYPQYLPEVGSPLAGESNLDRLYPLLEAEGVAYADLREPLRAETLYFRLDSHWNAQGAALAQQVLLSALEKDFKPFWQSESHMVKNHLGDLYEMLYPAGNELDWDVRFEREFTFTHVRQPRGPDDQRIETENPDKEGGLLMFRDSFGNHLYPFMAEEFGRALFSRAMPYQMSLLEETGADTVVVEIVERNLERLAQQAPAFPAPARLDVGTATREEGGAVLTAVEDGRLEGFVRLEGRISGPVDDDSPIYVQLSGGTYEASPVGTWEEGTPFALYAAQPECQADGCILYYSGGALCSSGPTAIRKG